jgi:hypothetical protein
MSAFLRKEVQEPSGRSVKEVANLFLAGIDNRKRPTSFRGEHLLEISGEKKLAILGVYQRFRSSQGIRVLKGRRARLSASAANIDRPVAEVTKGFKGDIGVVPW